MVILCTATQVKFPYLALWLQFLTVLHTAFLRGKSKVEITRQSELHALRYWNSNIQPQYNSRP